MDIVNPEGFFKAFPNLDRNTRPASPDTPRYNCIAWALGEDNRPWWPSYPDMYWPRECPAQESLSAFKDTFEKLGYEQCFDGNVEDGYEKLVLYAKGSQPTHAARQLEDGRWTSKCGQNVDIEHNLEELEGPLYGKVVMFFRRHREAL